MSHDGRPLNAVLGGPHLAEVERAKVGGERVALLLGERAQLLDERRVLLEAGVQAAEEGLLGAALLDVLVLAAELLPAVVALPGLLVQLVGLLLLPARVGGIKDKNIRG